MIQATFEYISIDMDSWEITFAFICPTDDWGVTLFFRLAVVVNGTVTYIDSWIIPT
jgi:hypothetical protein